MFTLIPETVKRKIEIGILSHLVKDPCHFGGTEHVCDALEVVCHCRVGSHLVTVEAPSEVNVALKAFLAGVRPTRILPA